MKSEYENMTQKQLKEHLLNHRTDEQAWTVFFNKLSTLDANIGYSPNLSDQEMEQIFQEKISQTDQKNYDLTVLNPYEYGFFNILGTFAKTSLKLTKN